LPGRPSAGNSRTRSTAFELLWTPGPLKYIPKERVPGPHRLRTVLASASQPRPEQVTAVIEMAENESDPSIFAKAIALVTQQPAVTKSETSARWSTLERLQARITQLAPSWATPSDADTLPNGFNASLILSCIDSVRPGLSDRPHLVRLTLCQTGTLRGNDC
jgi:hypothetical protein